MHWASIWELQCESIGCGGLLAGLWQARLLRGVPVYLPGLIERGRLDGVGNLYVKMAERGELLTLGTHTSDIAGLLRTVLDRWGAPDVDNR